jgi:hypothetical protein
MPCDRTYVRNALWPHTRQECLVTAHTSRMPCDRKRPKASSLIIIEVKFLVIIERQRSSLAPQKSVERPCTTGIQFTFSWLVPLRLILTLSCTLRHGIFQGIYRSEILQIFKHAICPTHIAHPSDMWPREPLHTFLNTHVSADQISSHVDGFISHV